MNQSVKKNGWNAGGGRFSKKVQLIAYLRYYAVAEQTGKDNTFLHLGYLFIVCSE